MRMMMQVEMDTELCNRAILDGSLMKGLQAMADRLKPEALYFTAVNGCRGAYVVFDLPDTASIPLVVEPLFQSTNAKVEIFPVMNLDDVQAGVQKVQNQRGSA